MIPLLVYNQVQENANGLIGKDGLASWYNLISSPHVSVAGVGRWGGRI